MKTFLFQKFYSVHFWHFFSAFDQSLLLYSKFNTYLGTPQRQKYESEGKDKKLG